jgi:hypothetical protein
MAFKRSLREEIDAWQVAASPELVNHEPFREGSKQIMRY